MAIRARGGRWVCRWAGRWVGRRVGRRVGRWVGRRAGGRAGRWVGRQVGSPGGSPGRVARVGRQGESRRRPTQEQTTRTEKSRARTP